MEDLVNSLTTKIINKITEILTECILYLFKSMTSFLSDTFNVSESNTSGTGGVGGLVAKFLVKHPANFEGNASAGVGLWVNIEKICNYAIVPIGGFILTIILLGELYQMVMRGNNFKDFDDSIFIKWIIKAVCGVLLISNTYYIASALFSFGTGACSKAISTLFSSTSSDLSLSKTALAGLTIGQLAMVLVLVVVVWLAVLVMTALVIVALAGRIIEIFMYLSIGPIPMATMMSEGEWSSVGKNWIREILALSFQGFFIIIAIGIFKTLFNSVIAKINLGADDIVISMVFLLGYSISLCFTVLRTGSISKSVFNAH